MSAAIRTARLATTAARVLIATALLGAILIPCPGGPMPDFSRLVPVKVGDWSAAGKDAVYDRKTLYGYMDGGAEVYLAFDFRQVFTRKYAGPDGRNQEISLDIYDMGAPAEAYGIFSCDREDPPAGIGQATAPSGTSSSTTRAVMRGS